jgi:aryl-alcohol dehydrogenase-like predicted oxidoreductase
MKIGLGTAQFGLDYGISNQEGQTSPSEVVRILDTANRFGVRIIDTAAVYGSSEAVLGNVLPKDDTFRLVTKTIQLNSGRIDAAAADRLENAFQDSLKKLRCQSVYGLMIHNADDLLAEGGELLMARLKALKVSGRTNKIGVSVYTADQVDRIMRRFEPDMVQLPLNVLDQRLLVGGQLAALKAQGVEIHVRSAFLQGVLLMEPASLPDNFASIRRHLMDYHNFLRERYITPVHGALGFLSSLDNVDVIVCGVNNHHQLIEVCNSSAPLPDIDFSQFALEDAAILNPSFWRSV